jgi:hypothetical protein
MGLQVAYMWLSLALSLLISDKCCVSGLSCSRQEVPARCALCPIEFNFSTFGRSHLQKSRRIREHTRFAHPYRFLLRKRPRYGDEEVRKNDCIEDTPHRG